MGRERGALQIRERTPDLASPAGVDRLLERAFGADQDGAGHEELCHVDVER